MRHPAAIRTSLAALAGFSLLLTACSPGNGTAPASSGTDTSSGALSVVASTNVYADIVRSVGGDKVSVGSIINQAGQDPHSYEATAQDRLLVSKADLVIENGGGYDDFLHKLADDSNIPHSSIVTAVEVSGLAPEETGTETPAAVESGASTESDDGHSHVHGEFNEHVWYSVDAMGKLADSIAAKLGEQDPASAALFTANAATFKTAAGELTGKLAALKANGAGAPVAVTEPVPVYLLEAAGLENRTPEDYTAAIEEGSDVPPAVLKAATDLAGSKEIRFLAYNLQTEGPQTEALKKAAESAGVPVIDFSETLPEGKTYLEWMTDNVENVSNVLEKNS
ncbi:metal ABC transporter solute-binding protein, Zn/Mn family [Arthrobacter sp. HMWF013]|uniref:metal ABC transporter solute-binding protein, Zn/Mn family n=1 Tax=Arthrobacter sp. HMWF013 TaxID=2056849 RepID=UPI000D3A73B3|nr:zinc ABC transporter substrate-binding protein [Arthrobacter sp. HMWF013]PTT63370.1 ABC transporter substrate-binding protein [Arthrobacter sp. HMWF013]